MTTLTKEQWEEIEDTIMKNKCKKKIEVPIYCMCDIQTAITKTEEMMEKKVFSTGVRAVANQAKHCGKLVEQAKQQEREKWEKKIEKKINTVFSYPLDMPYGTSKRMKELVDEYTKGWKEALKDLKKSLKTPF